MAEPLTLDIRTALDRVDNDKDLYADLYSIFKEEFPRQLEAVKAAYKEGDARELRTSAHSLKSAVGNLGAMKAYALVQVIETNAQQGRLDKIETNIKLLEEEVQKYKKAAEDFINSGTPSPG